MSKDAHAGGKRTMYPGFATFWAVLTISSIFFAPFKTGPLKCPFSKIEFSILLASWPIKIKAAIEESPVIFSERAEKSEFFEDPPNINIFLFLNDSIAA